MPRRLFWFTLLLSVFLAFTQADARVGGGGSFGSRGSRTYSAPPATGTSPDGAAPMQQSTTVPGQGYGSQYGAGGYGGYGYGRSHFGRGLMGGLLGFGLGSMLFGRGYGGGFAAFHLIFFLIKIAVLFFVVRWLLRRMNGTTASTSPRPSMFGSLFTPRAAAYATQAPPLAGPPVVIQAADYHAFETLLKNIQAAWSNNDLNALRQFASPEMVSTFAEQLADNASRGRRNVVSNVALQKGDLSEAWSEGGRAYATVAMRFSMTDATYDTAGHLVEGSATQPTTATEYWTFLRAAGGQWMLSAIQQAR